MFGVLQKGVELIGELKVVQLTKHRPKAEMILDDNPSIHNLFQHHTLLFQLRYIQRHMLDCFT